MLFNLQIESIKDEFTKCHLIFCLSVYIKFYAVIARIHKELCAQKVMSTLLLRVYKFTLKMIKTILELKTAIG